MPGTGGVDPASAGLAAFQIISGYQQAELVRKSADLAKQVNDMNAEFAEVDAFHAEQRGESEVARYQSVIDATLASEKVANAVNNVAGNFGTAAEKTADTKLNGFLNQLDIRNQAHQQALGYKDQARNYRLAGASGVAQAGYNANAMQNSAIINAGATTISGYTRSASASKKGDNSASTSSND